jgi:uncharacterized protein YkwD
MQELINLFTVISEQFNWVDALVVAVVIFYMIEGYAIGTISGLFDIISFLISFTAGLKLYKPLGNFLSQFLHLPQFVSHAVGFAFAAIIVELLLRIIQEKLTQEVQKIPYLQESLAARINRLLGVIPGAFSGLVLLAFLLTVIVVLPVSAPIKEAIGQSKTGSALVSITQGFEKNISQIFGSPKENDLLTFFTVEPETDKVVLLDFKYANGTIDAKAEEQMLMMVNQERAKRGLSDLSMDDHLQLLAREHSQDMVARGYFSHYTPEGMSPFDRMDKAGITYEFAGENLAFSQSTELAMQGLMASPGHKANILSSNFHKVGVGVISAGIYGEMFSQEFTN